jgi:hypothetical protein
MNTRFEYLYRDAGNYKQWSDVVLTGSMTREEIEPLLEDGMYFVPERVGLVNLAERFKEQGYVYPNEDDHDWHEVVSVSETELAATCEVSATEFLTRLRRGAGVVG